MRRIAILFAAFFASIAIAEAPPRIDYSTVAAFDRPWQDFSRRYNGCEEVTTPKDGPYTFMRKCYPDAGFTDLDSFRRAREAAKVLFGLH